MAKNKIFQKKFRMEAGIFDPIFMRKIEKNYWESPLYILRDQIAFAKRQSANTL